MHIEFLDDKQLTGRNPNTVLSFLCLIAMIGQSVLRSARCVVRRPCLLEF